MGLGLWYRIGYNPSACFSKRLGLREKGGRVPIHSHSKQHQIKTRGRTFWPKPKMPLDFIFIVMSGGVRIRYLAVHTVEVLTGDTELIEKSLTRHMIITVTMAWTDTPLIAPKKMDTIPRQLGPKGGTRQDFVEPPRGQSS